ncbi:MAG: sulfatase-like hydrolase/transferase, partial [Gammaproteobacteria bacterium]|nr:sulfatase-like hydrolase/transferase [Gammaproteobacteria bacterium]
MTRLTKSALLFGLSLLVFGWFRALLLWIYPEQFDGLALHDVVLAFVHGVRFDASTLVVVFIVPLLLMNFPLAIAQRPGWFNSFAWLLYVLTLIMVGVLVSDLIYFGFVSRHLGNEIMLLGNDGGFVLDMAFGSYKWIVLAFVIGSALLFVIWRRVLTLKLAPARLMAVQYVVMLLGLIIIGRGGITNKPISAIDAFTTGETRFGNLVLNGVFTAAHASNNSKSVNHHFVPLADALHSVQGAAPPDAEFPMLKRYPAHKTNYNIVFVMLESWDPKYIDSFGADHLKLTPNFDALAAQGLKFDNFYAAGQRSIEGAQAALTGLPILTGMPVIGSGLELSNISRLGSIAKSNGYSTLMVQS